MTSKGLSWCHRAASFGCGRYGKQRTSESSRSQLLGEDWALSSPKQPWLDVNPLLQDKGCCALSPNRCSCRKRRIPDRSVAPGQQDQRVSVCLCPLLTWEGAIFGRCVLQTDQQSRKMPLFSGTAGLGERALHPQPPDSPFLEHVAQVLGATLCLQPTVSPLRAGAGGRARPIGVWAMDKQVASLPKQPRRDGGVRDQDCFLPQRFRQNPSSQQHPRPAGGP